MLSMYFPLHYITVIIYHRQTKFPDSLSSRHDLMTGVSDFLLIRKGKKEERGKRQNI